MRNAKRIRDLPQIAFHAGLVLQHRRAANYFQVGNLCQVSENFILHAVSKKGVFLFRTEIFKRQDGNAFLWYIGNSAR